MTVLDLKFYKTTNIKYYLLIKKYLVNLAKYQFRDFNIIDTMPSLYDVIIFARLHLKYMGIMNSFNKALSLKFPVDFLTDITFDMDLLNGIFVQTIDKKSQIRQKIKQSSLKHGKYQSKYNPITQMKNLLEIIHIINIAKNELANLDIRSFQLNSKEMLQQSQALRFVNKIITIRKEINRMLKSLTILQYDRNYKITLNFVNQNYTKKIKMIYSKTLEVQTLSTFTRFPNNEKLKLLSAKLLHECMHASAQKNRTRNTYQINAQNLFNNTSKIIDNTIKLPRFFTNTIQNLNKWVDKNYLKFNSTQSKINNRIKLSSALKSISDFYLKPRKTEDIVITQSRKLKDELNKVINKNILPAISANVFK